MKNPFKTFQSFVNKCKRTSLPIVGMVKVENRQATITDLEAWVQFPTDLPDGMYDVINGEPFLMPNADPQDFPNFPGQGEKTGAAVIFSSVIPIFATCVAKDELRPVMNAIHINSEHIVASDAHVLRYMPSTDVAENTQSINVLFQPSPALLARVRETGDEPISVVAYQNHVRFEFDDCGITIRQVEGTYPNYKGIIPDWNNLELKCFSVTSETVQDLRKFSKAVKNNKVTINVTNLHMADPDLTIEKRWPAPELVPKPTREPDALICPMMPTDTDESNDPDHLITISAELLEKLLVSFKGTYTIGVYDKSRSVAVWLDQQTSKPKRQTPKPKPTPVPEPAKAPTPVPEQSRRVLLLPYSEKAIAVFNAPESLRETFTEHWGKYSKWLKHPITKETTPGWVFSKKRTTQIQEIIAKAS